MITQRLRGLLTLHIFVTTLIAASLFLAYAQVYRYLPFENVLSSISLLPFLFCVVIGMLGSASYLRRSTSRFHRLSWIDSARLTTRQAGGVALCIFAFMFAFKEREMSRIFVVSYLGLLWGLLLFLNVGLPQFICRLFFARERRIPTLFIGGPRSLERLGKWLASKEMLGLEPVGFLSDGCDGPAVAAGFLGEIAALPRVLAQRQVVQIIVLETLRTEEQSQFIIRASQDFGCRLLIYSNLAEQLGHPLVTITEEGHQFYTLQEEPLEDPLNRVVKRSFDLAVSIPVVVLALPPLISLVWLFQRWQAPGRLMFTQMRTGYGQRSFRILKFRSMYDFIQSKDGEAQQARRGDERVYPFGRFLRATSLDEFPQFINVLKGEMSIVGPRPHLASHDEEFSRVMRGYRTRFFVKPGITGLAQSQGVRGEITSAQILQRRITLDLAYVAQWSIWLDMQIFLKTAWQVVRPPKTAY